MVVRTVSSAQFAIIVRYFTVILINIKLPVLSTKLIINKKPKYSPWYLPKKFNRELIVTDVFESCQFVQSHIRNL